MGSGRGGWPLQAWHLVLGRFGVEQCWRVLEDGVVGGVAFRPAGLCVKGTHGRWVLCRNRPALEGQPLPGPTRLGIRNTENKKMSLIYLAL